MLYCTVNVSTGDKINHIYGLSTNKELCIAVADFLCYAIKPGKEVYNYKSHGYCFNRPIEKKAGLPMVISVDTDNESEVDDLVFAGKYTIEQEYEYPTFA